MNNCLKRISIIISNMKRRDGLRELRGYVKEVQLKFYRVLLVTKIGSNYYEFPRSFATVPLKCEDDVRVYCVDVEGKRELRIEKVESEQPERDEVIKAKFEELAIRRWQELEKEFGNEPTSER